MDNELNNFNDINDDIDNGIKMIEQEQDSHEKKEMQEPGMHDGQPVRNHELSLTMNMQLCEHKWQ